MSSAAQVLNQLSHAIETRMAEGARLAVAIRNPAGQHVSGMRWQSDVVVTSEQAVGRRDEYEVVTSQGQITKARVVGRDPGTNVLILKIEGSLTTVATTPGVARAGALALAIASDTDGVAKARLGLVNAVGPQWYSRSGGRIEQRINLDIRLSRTEEGGVVLDAGGALLGMSTLGSRGEVLVIPVATIERIVPQLLEHGEIPRGWLGVALQPVAVPDALRDAAGQASGMMVMSMVAEGPGANSGVIAGDILLTVEGASATSVRELSTQLGGDSIGKTLRLRLIRGGEMVQVEALITARPKS